MSFVVWGSELSPFTLKLIRLLHQAKIEHTLLPTEGGWRTNLRYAARRKVLVNGLIPLTWPKLTPDDEYPLVPFLFGTNAPRVNLYDSSAIAHWLDQTFGTQFVPRDPQAAFLVQLIDEYADELGLYMAHHNRWKVSATSNDAGERLAHEIRRAMPLRSLYRRWFKRRQVRRLPYLFSVAPSGFKVPGVAAALQPPSRDGFPPTHELLETCFANMLHSLECILAHQPFLLGNTFTLADASMAGQLGMNLYDPGAAELIRTTAPHTYAWANRLNSTERLPTANEEPISELAQERLKPLVQEIIRSFIPLMQQNHNAVTPHNGHTNEAAFNRHTSLYNGVIGAHPYRHVAKTFQAKVWRQLCGQWHTLDEREWLLTLGLSSALFDIKK